MHHERLLPVSILGFLVNLIGIFVFQHGGHGHSHDSGKTLKHVVLIYSFVSEGSHTVFCYAGSYRFQCFCPSWIFHALIMVLYFSLFVMVTIGYQLELLHNQFCIDKSPIRKSVHWFTTSTCSVAKVL